jgi:hypothetical protein
MEAMLGFSLYSYPHLNYQKCYVFLIIAYVFSSMKVEKRADQVLPGSEEGEGKLLGKWCSLWGKLYVASSKNYK